MLGRWAYTLSGTGAERSEVGVSLLHSTLHNVNTGEDGNRAAYGELIVGKVDKKQRKRQPTAPFTTSTLQQEAAKEN